MTKVLLKRRLMVFLMIGASLSVLFLVLLIASRLILLDSFVEIENNNMQKNVDRALNALNGELSHLSTINGDYAGWDDSYQFIKDGNREYIDENIPDTVFPMLNLNLLIYIRNNGDIVYKRAFDLGSKMPVPVPDSFLKNISPESPIVRHSGTESIVKCLLRLTEGIMMFSSRPILTNEYKGPIHGSLIMGRFLNSKGIELLA